MAYASTMAYSTVDGYATPSARPSVRVHRGESPPSEMPRATSTSLTH
jgi:hypothetical protein